MLCKAPSADNTLSTIPTSEWQDRLSASLTRGAVGHHGLSPAYNLSGAPLQQRRRLDVPSTSSGPRQPNWNEMYTMDALSGGRLAPYAIDLIS